MKKQFCGSSEHDVSRRRFLGTMGGAATAAAGMAGLNVLGNPALAGELASSGKRVIMLWLAGGASQLETFDPKPGRPTGGPFHPPPEGRGCGKRRRTGRAPR